MFRPALVASCLLFAACRPVPPAQPAPYHASDAALAVTRIVHGSVIVSLGDVRLLVDPWFHSGSVFRQSEPLGLLPAALPPTQAVLLTHAHADHFDAEALRSLAATVPVAICPPELTERVRALGFATVVGLGWWDGTHVGAVAVTAVPAAHAVPENGYVLERGPVRVYLAGDTRPYPELVDVATRFPHVDLALLPFGGQRLLGIAREMTPDKAAAAARLLDARHVVPFHYGEAGGFPFFTYAGNPVARFREACEREGIARDRLLVLAPGESWQQTR
jgi:L-ascorbate metabolism protein UlaG (beta-lactamase superfamily)